MKYVVLVLVAIGAFIAGVIFENIRIVDEIDKTSAVLMSGSAIDNSANQIKLNNEYLEKIENQRYEELKEKIQFSNEVFLQIKKDAGSICEQFVCSEKQLEYINNAKNKAEKT